ncbi:MAG: MATE family efflux transporter, partial [Sarcina sp.]
MIKLLTKNLFNDKRFYRTLFMLAIPIVIQNFITSSLNMVDTVMIGAVGENEVAAVGIANQFFFLFNLLAIGIGAGCSIFISQFWGKKDIENIKKVLGVGIISALIIGSIFTFLALIFPENIIQLFTKDLLVISLGVNYLKVVCLSYILTIVTFIFASSLRSIGNTKTPMIISIIAIITNTIFNYIFIFGEFGAPVMGVKGAALATLIARTIECILIVYISLKPTSVLYGKFKEYINFDFTFVKSLYTAIIPVVLNDGCWGIGTVLYTVAYGTIGTHAIAAIQISNTVQNLFMVVCFSLASASLVMIGNEIGANNDEVAKKYSYRFTSLSFLTGLALGILVRIFAPFILTFFTVSSEVHTAVISILTIFSLIAC